MTDFSLLKVRALQDSHKNVIKSKSKNSFDRLNDEFIEKVSKNLFNICTCKCLNMLECDCRREHKVPKNEREFLIDQKTSRKMFFSGIDEELTRKFERTQKRKKENIAPLPIKKAATIVRSDGKRRSNSPTEIQITPKKVKLHHTGIMLDRFGISDRSGASIVNGFIKDLRNQRNGAIAVEPVDRNKIRRTRTNTRKMITDSHLNGLHNIVNNVDSYGVYYDGKQNQSHTAVLNTATGNTHARLVAEDHYTILIEPGNHFYTHVTPKGKKAGDISSCMIEKLQQDEFDTEKICLIGCDGTNTNTGWKNGLLNIFHIYIYIDREEET